MHLARPESTVAGILACGIQERSHLEALASVFELTRASRGAGAGEGSVKLMVFDELTKEVVRWIP